MRSGRPDHWDPFSEYDFADTIIFGALPLQEKFIKERMRTYHPEVWRSMVLTPADWHGRPGLLLAGNPGVFLTIQMETKGMMLPHEVKAISRLVEGADHVTRSELIRILMGVPDLREKGAVPFAAIAETTAFATEMVPVPGLAAVTKRLPSILTRSSGLGMIGFGAGVASAATQLGLSLEILGSGKALGGGIGLALLGAATQPLTSWLAIRFGLAWDYPGDPQEVGKYLAVNKALVRYAHQHPKGG